MSLCRRGSRSTHCAGRVPGFPPQPFKKAYNIIGKSQIKLEVLVCAVRAAGGDADDQQVECMLANLIHQGLVKGYIAHKQQVVVLKKDDPFRVNA